MRQHMLQSIPHSVRCYVRSPTSRSRGAGYPQPTRGICAPHERIQAARDIGVDGPPIESIAAASNAPSDGRRYAGDATVFSITATVCIKRMREYEKMIPLKEHVFERSELSLRKERDVVALVETTGVGIYPK
jgi:hypothetical protein